MLDTIIKGGRVVTPTGAGDWDVGILGEKIVAVCIPGAPLPEAKEVIDATGKIVVPGGVEPHIHAASNVQPGIPESVPGVPNAGPRDHSLGAIWGGTTTVVDFAPEPASTTIYPSGRVTPTPTTQPTASTPAPTPPTPSLATAS